MPNVARDADTELLDRLERAIKSGVILWDGIGDFPGGKRYGISLASRSLRDAIRQGTEKEATNAKRSA